jgi:hypothetical protein
MSKASWHRHNPGKNRKDVPLSDKETEVMAGPRALQHPTFTAQKRRLGEDVEDPPHPPKRVARSSTVHTVFMGIRV